MEITRGYPYFVELETDDRPLLRLAPEHLERDQPRA
jgi:hypothetical protein